MLGVISLEVCTKQVRPGVRGELAKVFRGEDHFVDSLGLRVLAAHGLRKGDEMRNLGLNWPRAYLPFLTATPP